MSRAEEELDEQFLIAVELDDARDDRMARRGQITLNEMSHAQEIIATWPRERREELLRMEPNERQWFLLAAALFDARPESEGAE